MNTIDTRALAALGDGARIIDVREADEYADARIAGTTNIPLSTLIDRMSELPTDGALHLICASGGRSARAADYLAQRGYSPVNVEGGMHAWIDAGLPVERGSAR
jgi:rhodanese-related sulfurtransferase